MVVDLTLVEVAFKASLEVVHIDMHYMSVPVFCFDVK